MFEKQLEIHVSVKRLVLEFDHEIEITLAPASPLAAEPNNPNRFTPRRRNASRFSSITLKTSSGAFIGRAILSFVAQTWQPVARKWLLVPGLWLLSEDAA